MSLPDNVQFATVNPDGSQTLIFTEATAWVQSECATCGREQLVEILRDGGRVIGLRFLPSEPETLLDGMREALDHERAKRRIVWNSNWPSVAGGD